MAQAGGRQSEESSCISSGALWLERGRAVLIVHYAVNTDPGAATAPSVGLDRKILDPVEPIPPGAVWIDMVEPTVDEDQKVERYLGSKVPSRSDPDYAQPAESYYAENGVRYLHACVVSEAEGTPDVADVTFILGPKALVTVRYDPGEAFDLFGQRLGKIPTQALHPVRWRSVLSTPLSIAPPGR
jgi:Mg2+ and Co2+ transporter CorA